MRDNRLIADVAMAIEEAALQRPPNIIENLGTLYGNQARAAIAALDAHRAQTPDLRDAEIARLREALQALVDEYVDYATLNPLGDPEKQHNIRLARAALAQPEEPGHE